MRRSQTASLSASFPDHVGFNMTTLRNPPSSNPSSVRRKERRRKGLEEDAGENGVHEVEEGERKGRCEDHPRPAGGGAGCKCPQEAEEQELEEYSL